METPMKLVIDLSKPEREREQLVPFTPEELAQRELDAMTLAAEEAEAAAKAETLAALKASAKAKLISGQPLTPEEADTLVL
jgi:hypothetical protein